MAEQAGDNDLRVAEQVKTGDRSAEQGAKHTAGPLVARRINDSTRPWAVIDPNGALGDEIVAGYLTKEDAVLYAAAPDMLEALKSVATFSGDLTDDADLARLFQTFADCRAALSKAQGQQP